MAYTPTNWIDGSTALSASNMNNLEKGVQNNDSAISEIKNQINTDSNSQKLIVSTASYSGEITYYKKNNIVCISGKITPNFDIDEFTTDSTKVGTEGKALKQIAILPDGYGSPFGMHCHAMADNNKSIHVYVVNSTIRAERLGPGTTKLTSKDAFWFSFTYPAL